VLSDAQVCALLGNIWNPIHKACFTVMSACGLRNGKAATLEVKAIDSASLLLGIIGNRSGSRWGPRGSLGKSKTCGLVVDTDG